MMSKTKICLVFILLLPLFVYAGDIGLTPEKFQVKDLPQLAGNTTIEGAFFGSADGAIIAAGGTENQQFSDNVYILLHSGSQWESGFKLDTPIAYGVSVSTPYGLVCAGGADSAHISKKIFILQYLDGKLVSTPLPDLPEPRTFAAGAWIDDTIYIAAGLDAVSQGNPASTFWSLKLSKDKKDWATLKWNDLDSLPGPSRSRPVTAVLNGRLYIFGGLDNNSTLLKDAYCYKPGHGYTRLPDLPQTSAAPKSAVPYGDSHIVIFAGRELLAYHEITNTWTSLGEIPAGFSVTQAFKTDSGIILAGTEESGGTKIQGFDLLPQKKSFGWLNTSMLLGYLASLTLIGLFYARKKKTTSDYFVGGKKIPWWAAGLSIFGTQLSSIAFMAIPAKVYATDWTYFTSVIAIVLVQPIVIYFYLPFFRQLKVASVYEYLEYRFNLATRLIACLSFILFQTGRMTIVLFLPALALSAVTGVNIYICILVMGVVVTFYTATGGIEAVVWTDVLQVVVLIGAGLVSLLIVVINIDGGLGELWRISTTDNKLKFIDLNWDYTRAVFWVILLGGIFQNIISYTADQAVVQRYFVTQDFKKTAGAIWTNGILVLPVSAVWFLIGTSLYCFYKTHPASLDPTVKTDQIFPLFIAQELPVGVVGVVIAGLFAAAQSTISGSMNSVSTVVSTDFYQRFSRNYKDSVSLNLAKITTLLLGVMATGTALWMAANQDKIASLWDIYMMVLGLCMASVAGLFILGIFTTRTTALGALIGAVAGASVLYVFQQYTKVNFFLYSFIGAAACVAVGYTVSWLLPASKKDICGLTLYSVDLSKKK